MARTTIEENMAFMQTTLQRIERNEVSIDELEPLAAEFAEARNFCNERLAKIEAGLQETLHADAPAQPE